MFVNRLFTKEKRSILIVAPSSFEARKIYNKCHIYIEEYLGDYIEATMGPCKKLIKENPIKYKVKLQNLVMMHPLYLYFYVQSFKYNLPNDWYHENINKVKQVLDLAKE